MDKFAILFDVQLILIVITMLAVAIEDKLFRFERKAARRIREKISALRTGKRKDAEEIVVPAPAMTAEEIVQVCNSL